jgi:hypothetical protein
VASSRELSVRMACERHGEARQETVSLLGIPICHEDLQGVALGCRIGTAASEHTALFIHFLKFFDAAEGNPV